ncbi:hypothetical protein HN51_009992 [Arachis hypogaea]|uniref:Exonuclease V n=2 Tax=Arachis TaxID=3817 RepID=A0A445E4I1_ARAHY|nr:exonuclease V, chloroplastic [Arachis duranensis]XP_025685657.1 exonuclease V, chloroplastic [Arachis hypogaea]RYR70340.1 hypothetical protein Ahy_A03g016837 isoform B [Arachis hypogaea]
MAETSSEEELSVVNDNNHKSTNNIPIEIVSDEEMALIEAAFALASSSSARSLSLSASIRSSSSPSPPSPLLHTNALSIKSITLLAKRRLSTETSNGNGNGNVNHPDIEDLLPKKTRLHDSFLHRYRRSRGLSVTDLTAAEWCEKQKEFSLTRGGRRTTKAMRAGIARHVELEEEVMKRVAVKIATKEDGWALKFLNFIHGVNQLLFTGLTRELPIIAYIGNVWMVGVIDEIQMPLTKEHHNPILIDTKTRVRDTLPSEAQRRNGRFQLMCYKYLWDNTIANDFPSGKFFTYFSLNPHHILAEDLQVTIAGSDFCVSASDKNLTLDDMVRYYTNTLKMLAPAHDQLLLRYEYQEDKSLLAEDKFEYDSEWLKNQIQSCLEFWHGQREASYAPEDERWKCRYCQFARDCEGYAESMTPKEDSNDDTCVTHGEDISSQISS